MSALDVVRSFLPGVAPAPVPGILPMEQRSTLANPSEWLVDALVGPKSASGERVTVERTLGLDTVYACVSLLAGTAGSLPWIVYRGRGRDRKRYTTDPRYVMFHDEPNPETAADQFVEVVLAHVLLWGNGLAWKERGRGGIVRELWNVSPKGVVIERDRAGVKHYSIPNEPKTYTSRDVLHVPGFGYDGVRGLSVIGLARDSFGASLARQTYSSKLYANDATPGGVLSVQGELSPEAAERIRLQWEAAHRGAANTGRVAVLEGGAEWQSIGLPPKDQEFVAQQNASVNQIARWFGVPPEMVGGSRQGSLTYSTVEGAAIYFGTFSLRRWLVRLEKALKRDADLFPERDVYVECLLDALMRGDSKTRAEFYRTMREIGAMNPNEIRERENLPPRDDPGGDEFMETTPGTAPAKTGSGDGNVSDGSGDQPPVLGPSLNGAGAE